MNPRLFGALAIGETVVLVVYVLAVLVDTDLSSLDGVLRIVLALAAAVIAGATFQAWSATPSAPSLAAMLAGLLGGAALVSTVVSAPAGEVYGSSAVATVGTVGLVMAVLVGQVAMARSGGQAGRPQS